MRFKRTAPLPNAWNDKDLPRREVFIIHPKNTPGTSQI